MMMITFVFVVVVATPALVSSAMTVQPIAGSSAGHAEAHLEPHCIEIGNDPHKIVCVCDDSHCDDFAFDWPQHSGDTYLIETNRDGLRFKVRKVDESHKDQAGGEAPIAIDVDLTRRHQKILGWGGSFTDAAGLNINSLSEGLKQKLLASYFGEYGLQYNFARVPIAGSDFSTRPYSYDDTENDQPDYDLAHWSLAKEDHEYKIPLITAAVQLNQRFNQSLKLVASPWSPPKWMKTSKRVARGHLVDDDRVYRSYANYLLNFYKAYKQEGINFWGATVQNEPYAANLPIYFFNGLQMSTAEVIRLVAEHLGPALEANGYTKDNFKLIVGDDSLGFIDKQVPALFRDARVQKYVSGLAFHWYVSGTLVSYDSLNKLVSQLGDKIEFVMMSEACTGSAPWAKHVDLGNWDRGEAYASDIINDLLRHTGAWIDWNLALDLNGGPNWAKNFVDSPIIVDSAKNLFYKQPMYYALGHFSRFFREGSVRVEAELKPKHGYFSRSNKLEVAAVHNEATGHLVINVLNKSDNKKQINILVQTNSELQKSASFEASAKSISTLVMKL